MSIKCLRRHPGYFYVSCSPSKIPYVGFSPVRLQTGIRLRPSSMRVWVKHLACIHHPNINLYAAKVMTICSLMALYGQVGDYADKRSIHQDHPVQRPLTLLRVMLSPWVIAYYGLIRDSQPFRCLISFVQRIFALRPSMGWYRELPQFAPHICSIVPSYVPRRSKRLHMAVTSPFTLAFRPLRTRLSLRISGTLVPT